MALTTHTPHRSAHCRRIFGALDGRDFMTADGRWRLEVFSVVLQAANLWVQLRLVGDNPRVVTLRLPREADARQALQALTDRMGDPAVFQSFHNVA
jgi:hypothetical protein